jgi:2-haloacid dehalogenase
MSLTKPPKALLTDVFGTVVDWRATVTSHLTLRAHEALNSPTTSLSSSTRTAASQISWPAFAQSWRNTYYAFTRGYDPSGPAGFKSVDQHHLDSLLSLLDQHAIADLWTPDEIHKLSLIWHFLDPWPDSAPGLALLRKEMGFVTATLSNGNVSLLRDLATHGGLDYSEIISAEEFRAYKPHPSVYLGAARRLGLQPGECALVAAHLGDLKAAKECGFQTVYVERKEEEGWDREKVRKAREEGWVDLWVGVEEDGFLEIARRFEGAKGKL